MLERFYLYCNYYYDNKIALLYVTITAFIGGLIIDLAIMTKQHSSGVISDFRRLLHYRF